MGISTVAVPAGATPGQKVQFQVAAPVVAAQVVDPRTQPDDAPILQYVWIGAAYFVGGLSSWTGAIVNLTCRPPPTEREKEAAWYVYITAVINLIHLAFLVLCILITVFTDLVWTIFIGVHMNIPTMVFTNGLMLLLQFLNDSRVETRQKQQRAHLGGPMFGG